MNRDPKLSRLNGSVAALKFMSACVVVWGIPTSNPSWGQAAPQAKVSPSAARNVVDLPPPPPRKATAPISTPAHVPLSQLARSPVTNGAVAPPNVQNNNSPPTERLIDGLTELIPPLPATNVLPPLPSAADQFPNTQLPASQMRPSTVTIDFSGLPPLPGSLPEAASKTGIPGNSMPRMTGPSADSMGYGGLIRPPADPTGQLISHGAVPEISGAGTPSLPATNTLAPSAELSNVETTALPHAEEFPAGRLIAVVGYEHILAGDMAVFVEPIIEQNRAKIPPGEEEKKIRAQLTRQALRQYVEIKAIYQEFFRDMVGTVPPKELAETKKKVVTKAGKIFFEKQVPVLMEKYKVNTIAELEQKLIAKSLSLTTLRGQFIEQVLASELERKFVPEEFEIDREDLLNAYREEKIVGKWDVAARVRWRQLTVRFDKHATRQEADAKIRGMGNEVLGGKSFEATAKQLSEGYTASEGGVYDWTSKGSLKSKKIDDALFVLPPNQLSQIIEDDIGLHIVEVLEREAGQVKDFTEAQAELRESLSEERRRKEVRSFRDRIMNRTTVWTLWPEDIPGSRPMSDALGNIE